MRRPIAHLPKRADADRARFLLVALPEATPVEEAECLQTDLARWHPAARLGRQSERRRLGWGKRVMLQIVDSFDNLQHHLSTNLTPAWKTPTCAHSPPPTRVALSPGIPTAP